LTPTAARLAWMTVAIYSMASGRAPRARRSENAVYVA